MQNHGANSLLGLTWLKLMSCLELLCTLKIGVLVQAHSVVSRILFFVTVRMNSLCFCWVYKGTLLDIYEGVLRDYLSFPDTWPPLHMISAHSQPPRKGLCHALSLTSVFSLKILMQLVEVHRIISVLITLAVSWS